MGSEMCIRDRFLNNGQIVFVCRKLDKIPEIEKELRDRINRIRDKKWRDWCSVPVKNEITFKAIRETINWLSNTVSHKMNEET